MQLGLGRGGAALNVMDTWNAVVGGSMGYRALLVGALPRVSITFTGLMMRRGLLDSRCMVYGSQAGPDTCSVYRKVSCCISHCAMHHPQMKLV